MFSNVFFLDLLLGFPGLTLSSLLVAADAKLKKNCLSLLHREWKDWTDISKDPHADGGRFRPHHRYLFYLLLVLRN